MQAEFRARVTIRRALAGLFGVLLMLATPLHAQIHAQDHSQNRAALARVAGPLQLETGWRSVALQLPLTQPVPWRTRLMQDPPRAVVDFHTVDWSGFDPASVPLSGAVAALRVGQTGSGWSRLVIELTRPMGFAQAELRSLDGTAPTTGQGAETAGALLSLQLTPLSDEDFAAQAATLGQVTPATPDTALTETAPRVPLGQRLTRVVLDPGHGGVDPGASYQGVTESHLMLRFARELAAALRRNGRYEVVMTRDSDVFVSLEARITVAHSTRADVFLSLHADALEGQQARGATIYTLSEDATDEASAALAERHDRDDILGGGVDLTGTDETVAAVLMELARVETSPATERLARALVEAIEGRDIRMHRHPWQQAAFSVLKSPSVPSALIEVGFLSNATDRERLRDRRWRAQMAQALITGLDAWVAEEATQAALRRR
ncbi:N-acetylmuramoyl-L-alanine amidase family protein [Pararhodobacter oceanensis]|uniref:N-acetylmuramoyl-L-alanine amidase family protein n=1 Tax=Pararhodobacter oceanensis TaxID=2172121 RepID=UPI003A8E6D74